MVHRTFRGRGISQSQRRKKSWFQIKEVIASSATPGFMTVINLTNDLSLVATGESARAGFTLADGDGTAGAPFTSSVPEESTILRIRGSLLFPKNVRVGSGAIAGDLSNSIGFGVSSINDLQASSFPGPTSDPDWDGWMFLRSSAVSPVDSMGTVIDVKAMRKIKSGDVFFVMAESTSAGGSPANQSWIMDLRLLLLLP